MNELIRKLQDEAGRVAREKQKSLAACAYTQGMVCGKTCRCVEYAEILAGGPVKSSQCLKPSDYSPELKRK